LTRENVAHFFSVLKSETELVKYTAFGLFKTFEMRVTTEQQKSKKLISRNCRPVRELAPAEKVALVTVITCTTVVGTYVSCTIISPSKRTKTELLS
jgi:hypothetical protein